jgi:CRP/FNR family transcriptional regulator
MHVAFTPREMRALPANEYSEVALLRGTQYHVGDLLRFLQVELPEHVAADKTSFMLTTLKCRGNLYRAGSIFKNLYLVLSGLLMTSLLDEDGTERPTGFPSCGDIVGIDGIDSGKYGAETVALTPSLILILPFKTVGASTEAYPKLEETLHQLICRELVRTRMTTHVLRSFRCYARMAHFLLEIAYKLTNPVLPLCAFRLPISRREMANFLGLTYETISRTLTALHHQRIINVDGANITLLDQCKLVALKRMR